MTESLRVIFVGTPPDVRESRQLVLQNVGYDTTSLSTVEALEALLADQFDVMVISAFVPEDERHLLQKAGLEYTRIVQLDEFTPPQAYDRGYECTLLIWSVFNNLFQ